MQIEFNVPFSGFDYKKCWVAPVVSGIGSSSTMVLSMGRLDLDGVDVFEGSYLSYSKDRGASWTTPARPEVFSIRNNCYGGKSSCEIFTKYHKKSKLLLGFGHLVNYTAYNNVDHVHPRPITFSVFDECSSTWTKPVMIDIPDQINKGLAQFAFQSVELDDGDILMPVAATSLPESIFSIYTVRLRIEENNVRIIEYGQPIEISQPRGLYEPSLIRFQNKYFMTMRNDITGYVACSEHGLDFNRLKPWCFDNGELVGNYNTQQRWVRNGDNELYLIYTRRNANNDNVFRHRGPVMIAQVDPERLCILRDTEQVLIPNRGARMGNFMATEISPGLSIFSVAEWMQNDDVGISRAGAEYCASFGSDNSVYIASIKW